MNARATAVRFGLLASLVLLIIAASSLLGPTSLSWGEVLGREPSRIYWPLRVPRTCLAGLAGAGLAVAGVILQALFRNPLATPYTLGIASGASLGAALGSLLGISGYWLGMPRLSLLAFFGAILAMSLVYLMAHLRAGRDMTRLLLAGVCIAYMCAAGILLVTYLADRAVTNEIVRWMMGSLDRLYPRANLEIAAVLIPVLAYAIYAHRALDLLSIGEQLSASRGVAVGRTVWTCFVLVGVLTAVIVSKCGPIGFVGLMVPHMARTLLGVRTLPLVIGSALIGAAFLAACDGIARVALSLISQHPGEYELPVGVITNIVGAAFFFYLLATRDVSYAPTR